MRIYDTFLFFNELDLLECRLRELDDSPVWRFILVESAVTFQGKSKPLYFLENQERFAPWLDRIIHVTADIQISGDGVEVPWQREAISREAIFAGLKDADPEDVIMLSDVDEIPRASTLRECMYVPMTLMLDHHLFAVDWRHPLLWRGTTIRQLKNITSFEEMRRERMGEDFPLLANSGWHFSYLGGIDMAKEKARAFSHTEATRMLCDSAESLYRDGAGLGEQLEAIEIDDTFPQWIQKRECPDSWFRPQKGSASES